MMQNKSVLPYAIIAILSILVIACAIHNLMKVQGQGQQEEDDECIMGPNSISENSPLYPDAERRAEIKDYIDENKDDLNIPVYYDNEIVLCGIAMSVQQQEKEQGKIFDDEQLDSYIFIDVAKRQKDGMEKIMSDPERYLK
jgi:hypothetical protein